LWDGGQVVITRTRMNAGGMPQVFYLSPDMPARRLEGLPDDSPSEPVLPWFPHHRAHPLALPRAASHAGEFDIYVVASRQSYLIPLGSSSSRPPCSCRLRRSRRHAARDRQSTKRYSPSIA